jgi:hypothetical protein
MCSCRGPVHFPTSESLVLANIFESIELDPHPVLSNNLPNVLSLSKRAPELRYGITDQEPPILSALIRTRAAS